MNLMYQKVALINDQKSKVSIDQIKQKVFLFLTYIQDLQYLMALTLRNHSVCCLLMLMQTKVCIHREGYRLHIFQYHHISGIPLPFVVFSFQKTKLHLIRGKNQGEAWIKWTMRSRRMPRHRLACSSCKWRSQHTPQSSLPKDSFPDP